MFPVPGLGVYFDHLMDFFSNAYVNISKNCNGVRDPRVSRTFQSITYPSLWRPGLK
jgi:hypothetical protein